MDRRRAGALLALAACIACSATAPTASNHTALDLYDGAPEGCFYNFQHYGEGDRIMTNEPCLNCTCHNRMLMCYLRVCPFTKPIGQDCTIEKRADQCCPIVTCPDVPVDLLTSTSTTSPAEYGATGLGKLDKYGCSISGKNYPEGAKVPSTPNKPCEHCYCIRNMTTCVMQECTLHVDGCTPIYHKDVCCPVRYSCDHPEDEMPLLDDMSTTVRPTPGFLLTTTTISPVTQMTQDCVHDDQVFADGAQIKTEKACEHCYCMKGDIVCVVQECGTPMENEGKNCTSLPPREGQCCPDTYICEGDELGTELPTDPTTDTMLDSQTTLLPPRRTGVEGSGYRNEPDEIPYTDIPAIQPEQEGSGEEQVTLLPSETTEKSDSEKPLETDDLISATEEGLYTSYTTKSPSFEEPEDTTANKIPGAFEPQEYIPATTNVPMEKGDEIDTTEENVIHEEISEAQDLAPHEPISTTLASETYDKITTKQEEALNTVPDSISEEEDSELHKHIPGPTIASAEESESSTPYITKEETTTGGFYEEKVTNPEYSYPSPTTSADKFTDTTHDGTTYDLTTEKDVSEADKYLPSTPTSIIDEIETETPKIHESVTSVDIGKENDRTEPNAVLSNTNRIPTDKDYGITDAPNDDQHMVVEDDNTQEHLYSTTTRTSLEEVAGTTTHSMELGSGIEDITEENILESFEHTATSSSIETTAEPDKGLNTIPSDVIEESTSEVTDLDDTRRTDSKPTIDYESSTLPSESTVSKVDHFTVTTEPSFRKEDEIGIPTEKSKDFDTTTGKIDFTDEGFLPTSIHGTGPIVTAMEQEFTTSVPYNEVETKSSTTESTLEASISSEKLPELPSQEGTEFTFGTPTTEKVSEITLAPENESHDEQARIPGEGDCLLNGLTYRNNSVVPSTNNCHSGCKCVSSIIKCDPIICSPPPDYMDNCQFIYDSPDSCCPTYVCDHPRETVPPQSDNQMSGTESPQPSPSIECRGDQCELSIDIKHPTVSSDKPEVASHECGPQGCQGIVQKPEDSKHPLEYHDSCKDGKCAPPADDCADGKCEVPISHELICDPKHGCQAIPVKPCEGEHCKETSEEAPKSPQLCEGDSCKFEVPSPQDTPQVPCKEDGCKSEQVTPQECTGDSCRRNEIPDVGHNLPSECEGPLCEQHTEMPPEKATQQVNTESEVASTQQPHIPDSLQDISTITPEMLTVSHEIVSESKSPLGSNEIETGTIEERRTTVMESYATDGDKSSETTEKVIGPVTENDTGDIPEAHTFKPKLTTSSSDKLPEVYVTESQQTTETGDKKDILVESTERTVSSEISRKTTYSDQQTTEKIGQEYTTKFYNTEKAEITTPAYDRDQSEVTKLHGISSVLPNEVQEFEDQTTQSPVIHELVTGEPVSVITDVKDESTTVSVETESEKTHVFEIPETSVTDSEENVSKTTEPTTEEEYGFTGSSGYKLPETKPEEIEPIRIEPLEGTTESQKSPTVAEESTSDYITEKELSQVSDNKHTESPEQYTGEPDQPISKPPVDISSGEQKDTDINPVIQEHVTDILSPSTTEPERSFTEIDDIVTDEDLPTTKKSIPDETISIENLDTSPELNEYVTTEKIHDVYEISPASSEKPRYTDSLSVDITEPIEISTKTSEQVFTDKPQDFEINTTSEPLFTESPIFITTTPKESHKPVIVIGQEEKTTYVPDTDDVQAHYSTKAPEMSVTEEQTDNKLPQNEYTKIPFTTDIPRTPAMQDESTQGLEEMHTELPISQITTKVPMSLVTDQGDYIGTTYSVPVATKDETVEPGLTIISETTKSQAEVQTEVPTQTVPELLDTITKTPEDTTQLDIEITRHAEYVTKGPIDEEDIEPGRTGLAETITKPPEDIEESRPELEEHDDTKLTETESTGKEEKTTKSPEDAIGTKPEITQNDKTTKVPEDTKVTQTDVTVQDEKATNPPEITGETETVFEDTRRKDDSTKAPGIETQVTVQVEPEVTKAPEDIQLLEPGLTVQLEEETIAAEDKKQHIPKVTNQQEDITKAPEFAIESESHVSTQDKEVTKTPTDKQQAETEVTKAPQDTKESLPEITGYEEQVTKAPEDVKAPLPDITGQKDIAKLPEDTKESLPEITIQEEKTTKAPEETKESLPEITKQEEVITKAPEDIKESQPEVNGQEAGMTKAPEYTKESVPAITGLQEEVTKTPEDTEESVPESSEQGEEVTKTPEDTKESVPQYTGHGMEVTKAPEDAKTSVQSEITGQEQEVTKAPEDTKDSVPEITGQEQEVTKAPEDIKESLPVITVQQEEVTKTPEDIEESVPGITEQQEEVTKTPEDTEESVPEITGQQEEVTKAPEDMKDSVTEYTGHEKEVTKAPEDAKISIPEITGQELEVTKAPEDTKESVPEITGQAQEVTQAPEDTKESLPEITGQQEEVTKTPEDTKESVLEITEQQEEVTNAPEDKKGSVPEITGQREEVTKAPEDTNESVPASTGQQVEVTKAPEDTKESVLEITGQEQEITQAPEDTKESLPEITGQPEEVTKTPEDTEESVPEITAQQEEVTKAPEDTKESVTEITGQQEEVTMAPEHTKESVPKITEPHEEDTKTPEDTKESVPEITGQEQDVTKAPEETKESIPEITGQQEEVTKTPEDTEESLPEITGQEQEVHKVPEDTRESVPEITEPHEDVTKTPEGTKESVPEITGQEQEVTKAPEDTKELIPEITGQQEEVTKTYEDTEESVPKITGQEQEVTKAPEDTKESIPEITGQQEEVTKTPEDTEELVPKITGQEQEVTKAPEDTRESVPKVTGEEQEVTMVPEDTKESLPETIGQEEVTKESVSEIAGQEEVTKAPEDTKESIPEITGQHEEVTNAPEETKETVPEITGQEQEVTKAPEDEKESGPEITGQEEEVTKAPEDEKESRPEITEQEEEVTKAPEDTEETVPVITGQKDEFTKAPEDTKESEPKVTGQEQDVTKAPHDTKDSVPEITGQQDEVTKAPEDAKESVPEITGLELEVTKAPEQTKESLPEATGQEEIVTKAPEDTKESTSEVTGQGEDVTKASEDKKHQDSQTEIPSEEEKVTKTPDGIKELESEITELSPGDSATEKQETTPTLLEVHEPHEVVTENIENDNKLPEDTTIKQIEEVATDQPKDQFSETTPDVIILEEHTHKIMEETSTATPYHEEKTTVFVDSEAPGSEITSQKPTEEHTVTITKEIEETTKADEALFTSPTLSPNTLTSIDQKTENIPESSLPTAITSSDHKNDESQKEKEPSPAPISEETTLTDHIDSEKSPTPATEFPIQTEKIPSPTEKPIHHDFVSKTTIGDEIAATTPRAPTATQQEVTAMADDKLTKPGDKPIVSEVTPSTTIPESPKPSVTQPTDELPTPEEDSHFPPSSMTGYGEPEDYGEEDQAFGPGTCRYGGKVYVSAQQIPRDDPCDFCFCFRSDIICLQQSCPPPIHGCHEEPIQGFCCPRYECPVSMATTINMTTTTTTTTTTLPPHFPTHSYKGAAQRRGCQIKGHTYKVGEVVRSSSGPCLHCTCGGDGQMKCDPKACTPEPMLRQMIAAAVSAKRRR